MKKNYEFTLAQRWTQIVEKYALKTALIYSDGNSYSFSNINLLSLQWIYIGKNSNL